MPAIRSVSPSSTGSTGTRPTGRSWSKRCGTTGQFTYLRSHAQESPALYELRDGEPALVAYDLTEEGLYIVRHVLGDGWLQIGDKRASWRFTPREGLK